MDTTMHDASNPEVMKAFYRRLFPVQQVFMWLNQSHVPSKLWTHREFAFTLPGDVYLRYQSFLTAEDLRKQLIYHNPTRFEIGPIYSGKPKERRTLRNLVPVQRELVFDIDMTDYDSIRTCCRAAGICDHCWGFIAAAVRVLHDALTDQFGFKHILWVYSGRRGIHAWVSDREAMELNDEARRAVVGYLAVIIASKDGSKKLNIRTGPARTLPPSLQSALDPLAEVFTDLILDDQDCFREEEGWEALLGLIPDGRLVDTLRAKWTKHSGRSSREKWSDLKSELKAFDKGSPQRQSLEDIILSYTYPRLDAEVSKHRNHLLKAPFCVHPKTGMICVPVDPERLEEFRIGEVPTVGMLVNELDKAGGGEVTGKDWDKTSLKPYVEMLERHTLRIMDDIRRESKTDVTW